MIEEWLSTTWSEVGLVIVSTTAIFAAVVIYVRIVGLRSFSKMSAFDFAMTVAVGSLMATVAVTSSATLANGLIALGTLFAVQFAIALLRRRSIAERWVDNSPRLLMAGSEFHEDNMRTARVTRRDVMAKLREANVLDPGSVRAVVLETTGNMSVLHGDASLDPWLLEGVIGAEEITRSSGDDQPSAGSTSSR